MEAGWSINEPVKFHISIYYRLSLVKKNSIYFYFEILKLSISLCKTLLLEDINLV